MKQFENPNLEEAVVNNQAESDATEASEEVLPDLSEETSGEVMAETPKKAKNFFLKNLYEYIETFTYALVLMVVLLLFVFRPVTVDGASMQHTLHHEDKLIISNLFYTPKTGDVVVINPESHGNDEEPIIKRVIATEGQKVFIDYKNWEVFVDGVKLDEPYIQAMRKEYQLLFGEGVEMHNSEVSRFNGEFTVADGTVFVMGDNRNNSRDSRSAVYGEMSVNRILGRVVLRIAPEFGFMD